MHRIERRDIRATECHSAAWRAVGSGWSTQPNGHREPAATAGNRSPIASWEKAAHKEKQPGNRSFQAVVL